MRAVIRAEKPENYNRGELFQDNAIVQYPRLPLAALDERQRGLAADLISLYTGRMRVGDAEMKLTEIVSHRDDTWFAWVGGTQPDAVFYYRIHSPIVMIEYDHQSPVVLDGPRVPCCDHVHTVVRVPNGNDYGKDLLGQHLLARPH